MPEKVMKHYTSPVQALTCSYSVKVDGNDKRETIYFNAGKFSTDDPDKQAHIEGLDSFGKLIFLAPSQREILEKNAKDLRSVAVKANAAAKEAEDALEAFDKPAPAVATEK